MISTFDKSVSFGLLRVLETLKTSVEITSFENSCQKIASLYEEQFTGLKSYSLLNAVKKRDLSDYQKDAQNICGQANKHNVYLDRPNDPLSCLALYIVDQS